MRVGSEFSAAGVCMIIRQAADKKGNPVWTAQVTGYPGAVAALQCEGQVIALPGTATIITAEKQLVERR
ncbi:MAG: hypothetical protein HC843_07175 [Sphingomonadales bacterium]|nr:hypothetical protein [Sphingomonadales bacterium]